MIYKWWTRRTAHDFYVLEVLPLLDEWNEALEIWHEGELLGWRIQPRYY